MVLPFRSLASAAVVVITATAALLPGLAHAQSKSNQGTPMSLTPATGSEAFGCETRWQAGFAPPFSYERQPTGLTTCTAYQPGTTVDNTHLVPGPGYVTKVRVRSGANPAPLRVTIVKRLFQTNPATGEITDATCCTGTGSESATFQPPANTVHELTLNPPLRVTTSPSQNGASGHHDIVSVSAMGAGELPIASTGPHSLSEISTTALQMFYPKVETGQQGQAQHDYVNYVVLMNYDWTVCPSAGGATASQACPGPGAGAPVGGAGGGGTGTKAAPLSFKSRSLKLKKNKVSFRLACTSAKGTSCKGKARLRTRAKKPKTLAAKSLTIAGGKTKTITFKLSSKARKTVRSRKTTKVTLAVDLGAGGSATKNLKLKR